MLDLKRSVPELQMRAIPDSTAVTEWFGMSAEGPWKDQRVRQAVQYSWDRDTFIDVFFATDKMEAQGIPTNKRWNTAIPCGGPGSYMYFPGMWLDPESRDFGPNAKYFTLGKREDDIAEAKKLLSAAGFGNGIDFKHIQYPLGFRQQDGQDIIEGMMQDINLHATQERVTIPDIFNYIFHKPGEPGGNWKEMLNTVDFGGPDVGNYLLAHFSNRGNLFGGWNPDDKGATVNGDPFLNDTTDKVLLEFDNAKRVGLVQEFQRYMAKMFYYSRYPGGATSLQMTWPAVANYNVFRGYGLDGFYTYEWLDTTKKPLA
jgi:ABC-type transport system substrate-binding protein